MLSLTGKKFKKAGMVKTRNGGGAGEILQRGAKIFYGNWGSRRYQPEGMKRQNATLSINGDYIASYDADTDEVYH